MEPNEFLQLVAQMREAQRAFYRGKGDRGKLLQDAKELERRVDKAIAASTSQAVQKEMFSS